MKNGIGFSRNGDALIMDLSAVPGAKPIAQTVQQPLPGTVYKWAPWGDDNLLPLKMVQDIEKCGILDSIIDGKARFALCEGLVPVIMERDKDGKNVIKEYVDDPIIKNFLDRNNHYFQTFGWMKDLIGLGNGVARLKLSRDKSQVVLFQRDDVTEMRFELMAEEGQYAGITRNIYLSAQWEKVTGDSDKYLKTIPLLNPNDPVGDLQARKDEADEFAITFRYPGWNKKYYSIPLWYAAYKWVKIAQGIPEMKSVMFNNAMRPSYMVILHEKFWEYTFFTSTGGKKLSYEDYTEAEIEQKRQEVYDDMEKNLMGGINSFKSIFTDSFTNEKGEVVPYVEIKSIKNEGIDGELLKDSSTANSEIAFSMLFNPAIIGASLPSGPYTNAQGGSNVRESVLIQVIIHELERQHIKQVMNVIKYFNGWDKTHPGLEFIIPATIPSTLDTGSNVKNVVMGGGSNQNNNGADQNNTGN